MSSLPCVSLCRASSCKRVCCIYRGTYVCHTQHNIFYIYLFTHTDFCILFFDAIYFLDTFCHNNTHSVRLVLPERCKKMMDMIFSRTLIFLKKRTRIDWFFRFYFTLQKKNNITKKIFLPWRRAKIQRKYYREFCYETVQY